MRPLDLKGVCYNWGDILMWIFERMKDKRILGFISVYAAILGIGYLFLLWPNLIEDVGLCSNRDCETLLGNIAGGLFLVCMAIFGITGISYLLTSPIRRYKFVVFSVIFIPLTVLLVIISPETCGGWGFSLCFDREIAIWTFSGIYGGVVFFTLVRDLFGEFRKDSRGLLLKWLGMLLLIVVLGGIIFGALSSFILGLEKSEINNQKAEVEAFIQRYDIKVGKPVIGAITDNGSVAVFNDYTIPTRVENNASGEGPYYFIVTSIYRDEKKTSINLRFIGGIDGAQTQDKEYTQVTQAIQSFIDQKIEPRGVYDFQILDWHLDTVDFFVKSSNASAYVDYDTNRKINETVFFFMKDPFERIWKIQGTKNAKFYKEDKPYISF